MRRRLFGRYFSDLEQNFQRLENDHNHLRTEHETLEKELNAKLAELTAVTAERDQLWLEARRNTYDLTFPPDHLQARVVGASVPHFLWSGEQVALDIERAAAGAGIDLSTKRSMLDFGCGVARVTRVMAARHPAAAHCGGDIDSEAIAWDAENLSHVARFEVLPHRPPTPFDDAQFDFIYGISVFTHLPEDMQFEWLQELQRITMPGAHLLLTFHGEHEYVHLPPERMDNFRKQGFDYVAFGNTPGLPDFYQVAFHTADYIRQQWGIYFDVVKLVPEAISGKQDAALLRRRPD